MWRWAGHQDARVFGLSGLHRVACVLLGATNYTCKIQEASSIKGSLSPSFLPCLPPSMTSLPLSFKVWVFETT